MVAPCRGLEKVRLRARRIADDKVEAADADTVPLS